MDIRVAESISLERADRFDFLGLVEKLWRYKVLIIIVSLLAGGVGVYIALTATPIFRADAVITNVRESGEGGLASLAGQLGSLGSLASMSLGGVNAQSQESHAVLQSRRLIEEFITRNNLLSQLLPDSKQAPVMWMAVRKFQDKILTIHEDSRKGTTTVSIDWTDPEIAARWANDFVALANDQLRSRAIDESKRNLAYLNDQIIHLDSVELRTVMYDLIKSETKTLMLANGRVDYAFRVVDPAVPPAQRSKPQRSAIVLSALVLGFFFSSLVALAHERIKRRTETVRADAHVQQLAR